jgi:hypothetical protein
VQHKKPKALRFLDPASRANWVSSHRCLLHHQASIQHLLHQLGKEDHSARYVKRDSRRSTIVRL